MQLSTQLAIFDLDGTLIDSQATIVACARTAFIACDLEPPTPDAIRRIVGLSLVPAMEVLLGRSDPALGTRIAEAYREAFIAYRNTPDFEEPLFPGVRPMLESLASRGLRLGVATGKSRRGVDTVLAHHGLTDFFVTLQTADRHPSKPHPAMLEAAMAETGIAAEAAAMIGDTSFDILMARAAGVHPVGVAWGNHPARELTEAGAAVVITRWSQLDAVLGLDRDSRASR